MYRPCPLFLSPSSFFPSFSISSFRRPRRLAIVLWLLRRRKVNLVCLSKRTQSISASCSPQTNRSIRSLDVLLSYAAKDTRATVHTVPIEIIVARLLQISTGRCGSTSRSPWNVRPGILHVVIIVSHSCCGRRLYARARARMDDLNFKSTLHVPLITARLFRLTTYLPWY